MGGKKSYDLMLEVGHKSQPLKAKLANGYTHKWTVFVKGANNSKVEHCIKRVVFQLHESFPIPSREVTSAPYQVKETGYAGFEIPIEIYFKSKDKPNFIVYILDLCLLTDAPNANSKMEKITFKNPSKDFEKLLLKSGAQLVSSTKDKKERSDSPPAKRQKSSSLIPSKDMCTQQSLSHSQGNNHSSHSPAPQSNHLSDSQTHHHHSQGRHSHQGHNNHSHNSHTNSSATSSGNSLFGNHTSHQNSHNSLHDSRHQAPAKTSNQTSSLPKTKSSSKEFIDVFGAPLVYNNSKSHRSNGCKTTSDTHKDVTFSVNDHSPIPPITHQKSPQITSQSHGNHHHKPSHHHGSHHHNNHNNSKHTHSKPAPPEPQPPPPPPPQTVPQKVPQKQPQPFIAQADPFTTMQNKISSLTDCDCLQKIVDIIEESGEWFNLTPNKFEFDLKRLDKRTLSRIEKCLQL